LQAALDAYQTLKVTIDGVAKTAVTIGQQVETLQDPTLKKTLVPLHRKMMQDVVTLKKGMERCEEAAKQVQAWQEFFAKYANHITQLTAQLEEYAAFRVSLLATLTDYAKQSEGFITESRAQQMYGDITTQFKRLVQSLKISQGKWQEVKEALDGMGGKSAAQTANALAQRLGIVKDKALKTLDDTMTTLKNDIDAIKRQ
jgi:Mg2+ and Co2+ transporter CorA